MPIGRPGSALRCRVHASGLSSLQRHLNRAVNEQRSGRVIAGMVLVLALCGWISGGEDGVRWALTEGTPRDDSMAISPEEVRRRFGARLLHPSERPELFGLLRDICRRAQLARLPDVYYIANPNNMNAYALGGPNGSAITLTEGLLGGMTLSEIGGILAHEVAHIRNNDGSAMSWAAALQRAIGLTSLVGLASLQARRVTVPYAPLALLLGSAPAIAHLLGLALSRIRELDADALALELIDNPQALVTALHKLERHHTGSPFMAGSAPEDSLVGFLRSHPTTWERVGVLMSLTHRR